MNLNVHSQPMYDPPAVQPMRDELKRVGVRELLTPADVDAVLKEKGTTLIVVNSVCGCAAGSARPAVMVAPETDEHSSPEMPTFLGMPQAARVADPIQVGTSGAVCQERRAHRLESPR